MTTKIIIAASLISILVITGTYLAFNSDFQSNSDLGLNGTLTPTEYMICIAKQFKANDYDKCINNDLDKDCKDRYIKFTILYRTFEDQFNTISRYQPSDIYDVIGGWISSCNAVVHYYLCGIAEQELSNCLYGKLPTQCSRENPEFIKAARACENQGDVPLWEYQLRYAECINSIVGLAKGELAISLQCK